MKPGGRDRQAPDEDGADHDPPEPSGVLDPAGRQRGHDGSGGDRRVEQAGPARARVVDGQREHGEQRARHPERHRHQVDRERAHQRAVAADEGEALLDRADDREVLGVGGRGWQLRQRRRDAEHDHEADRLRGVGAAGAERGDHQAAERRSDDRGDLVEAVGDRERRSQAVARERGDDRRARDVVDRRPAGEQRGEDEDQRDRRFLGERDRRQGGRGERDRRLRGEHQTAPLDPVGDRARRAGCQPRLARVRRFRAARRAPPSASACTPETGSRPAPLGTRGR